MDLCFDIETNGFLDRPDLEIHCIVARDVDTGKEFICDTSTEKPQGGFKTFCKGILGRATRLIGHNIAQYDLPVLERLLGWTPGIDVEIYDTLFASRLIFVSNMYERSVKRSSLARARSGVGPTHPSAMRQSAQVSVARSSRTEAATATVA